MRAPDYVVACLAGAGVGPELMAEATRTLHDVSRMHGFRVDDIHVPFGDEALARAGNPLPLSTRSAYMGADAVLVADIEDPTLQHVELELDLRAAVTRVRHCDGSGFTLVTPLEGQLDAWAIERAFSIARSSRACLASIDESPEWRRLVDVEAAWHDGVEVQHLSVAEGLPAAAFDAQRFDVIVAGRAFADTLHSIATSLSGDGRVVATGRLAGHGPGVFAPAHADRDDVAGQGVADPSSILLAVSLMLAEGLGERTASETLGDAVAAARAGGRRTGRTARGVTATTRELSDAVLGLLPRANRNAEFHPGIL